MFLRVVEKGRNERFVPVPDEAHLILRAYLGHEALKAIGRTLPDGDEVLFANTANPKAAPHRYHGDARRLRRNSIRRMIEKYGRQAGVPAAYCHPRAFRHLYGTQLAEAGVDLVTRMALMGHRSVEANRIYDHMALSRLREAAASGNPLAQIQTPVLGLVAILRERRPAGKKTRLIGIPTLEDKVLQRAVLMVLEPVYEQDFMDCSYGFRPGRSAHQALDALWQGLMGMGGGWIIGLDIQSFFDDVDWDHLRRFLGQRVRDGVIRRVIGKWLNAGVMESGEVSYPDQGTPQGGVVSPLLSNLRPPDFARCR